MNLPTVAGARHRNNRLGRDAKGSVGSRAARACLLAHKGDERRAIVLVTGTAQREAWIARTPRPVEEVRADLWSVPVPIPDNRLRYTLTYLIAAEGGLVVVDPGWDTNAGWNALADGLRQPEPRPPT